MALQSDNAEPHKTENLRRLQHQQAPCFSSGSCFRRNHQNFHLDSTAFLKASLEFKIVFSATQ